MNGRRGGSGGGSSRSGAVNSVGGAPMAEAESVGWPSSAVAGGAGGPSGRGGGSGGGSSWYCAVGRAGHCSCIYASFFLVSSHY